MGQYKVPQNVEAEDKIIGPLTFRQFIYALIGFGWGALCVALFRNIPALMIVLGFPPAMLFLLLAFYNRDGQNFEQILIAMVGFFAASRQRLWVKEDLAETFHIEPTKKAAEISQRNPVEVRSELEKLAGLIDSRGWNKPSEPESLVHPNTTHEERIVTPPPAPHAPDEQNTDMLDASSPLAANLAELLNTAANDVRSEAMEQMAARPAHRSAASISGVTAGPSGDILRLATQSDDLTVSALAAHATRVAPLPEGQTVEVRPNGS